MNRKTAVLLASLMTAVPLFAWADSNWDTLIWDQDNWYMPLLVSTVTPAGSGSVSPVPDKPQGYDLDEAVSLIAVPASCYDFSAWSGDCAGTNSACDLSMDVSKSVTASFQKKSFPLSVVSSANGSITPSSSSYECGASATLTANPDACYQFSAWSGQNAGECAGATCNLIMDAAKSLGAEFVKKTFSLTHSATNGSISPALSSYDCGSSVTLTATPNGGYWFTGWTGDISGNQSPVTLTVSKDMNITANFSILPLALTPAEVTLEQRGITELSVSGGEPPYIWTSQAGSLSAATGDRTAYTAPETVGEYWVRVTDARNQTAEAAVSVILAGSPPVITPATATLFVGETKKFQIAGGKKPYVSISTLHGQISEQGGDTFIYTAPGLAANDTVTVTDSLGQKASVQIQTVAANSPNITPAEVTLAQREITELSVTGGKSPYAWTVQAGNLSVTTGDRTAYTAPETIGEYWVRVTDAFNQTAEMAISVIGGSCVITPAAATLSMGETKNFQIAGGKKPYVSISALHGEISEQGGDSFIYTAPGLAASDTVTVTDNLGQKCSAQITVQLIGDLFISPASVHLLSGTTQTVLFRAVNGEEPFAWTAPQGGELQEDGGQAIYTPSTKIGKYPVQVTDGQNFAQAFVSIVNIPKISPARVMLQVEDLHLFQVAGGKPPYVWTAEQGGFSMVEGTSTKHIAPGNSGVYQITVTDALGHISTAQIAANDGLQIRPIQTFADINETRYFMVSGGMPPYTWSDGSQGAGVEIAHSVSGQHEIFVSDSAGHSAAALLEVKAMSMEELLPKVTYAKPGESVVFKIEPPGQYVWKAEAGGLAGHEGQLIAYAVPEEPGKYYVQVSDGSRVGYTEVLVGLGFIELDGNVPENTKPVLSRISVDGVPRHERVLEGDQETLWDIEFFMSLPDDGQLYYNTHLAILWTQLAGEIPPLIFLQTNNPDEPFVAFHALPPGAPLPANREGVNGEQTIAVYHGALAGVTGMLDFFLGYAPASKPEALVYTPVPYRLDVK
ncbi:MAG: hypothetical protein GY862_12920 [Gammaproteobacteria bacterium]|nr:hypothetical protein [Gammaproteobacteria bacterium]